jgi:hypothetical protein
LFAVVVAIATFALAAGQAFGATVRWGEDTRSGPTVWIDAAEGERVDLTLRASGGTALQPTEVVVENAAGTLTSLGTFPAAGSCDPWEVECRSPCHIETAQRARCSVYDGFTRPPKSPNPYESSYPSFYGGVWLYLSTADDRITVPVDNPVRFRMRSWATGGANTWDLSRVSAGIESGGGDVITSGVGANVSVGLWGPNTFYAVNGRPDYAYCYYNDTYAQTMRVDPFDETGTCAGDILPPPTGVGPVPAPPDAEDQLRYESDRVAAARRCIERNVEAPGSCTAP